MGDACGHANPAAKAKSRARAATDNRPAPMELRGFR
jgi:hypothetical protein